MPLALIYTCYLNFLMHFDIVPISNVSTVVYTSSDPYVMIEFVGSLTPEHHLSSHSSIVRGSITPIFMANVPSPIPGSHQ